MLFVCLFFLKSWSSERENDNDRRRCGSFGHVFFTDFTDGDDDDDIVTAVLI